MKLQIWHVVNVPGPAFRFDVPTPEFALKALRAIWEYDNFLGDGQDKPWTTVGARARERNKLAGKDLLLCRLFLAYNKYQLSRCPGGVPLVASNASGLETWDEAAEEWYEWEDEMGRQIDDLVSEEAEHEHQG